LSENLTLPEEMWKNMVQLDTSDNTIWRMCVTYWITKTTDSHPEYVILIAFPR